MRGTYSICFKLSNILLFSHLIIANKIEINKTLIDQLKDDFNYKLRINVKVCDKKIEQLNKQFAGNE